MFVSVNLSLSSKDKKYEDIICPYHKEYEDIIVKLLPDSHWRGLEPSYVLRHQLKGGQVVVFLFCYYWYYLSLLLFIY